MSRVRTRLTSAEFKRVCPSQGSRHLPALDLRVSNRISRARVPGAGGPDARRGDESTLRSRSTRSSNDADGSPPPGTLRAGPICVAGLRRTSSSCLSVDTTSGALLALLASLPAPNMVRQAGRPGATPFPTDMSSKVFSRGCKDRARPLQAGGTVPYMRFSGPKTSYKRRFQVPNRS